MAPNPNPSRTTAPMWAFIERVLALEPGDFVFAGAYVFKSGYHATVADNLAHWPGTYSIRLAADLRGPRDKGRALDIKSRQAAGGAAPTIMARYGARLRAAALARDPRVRKWREVLGQFDTDTPPEGIDFQSTAERVPDDTHVWHFHFSILTEFVDDLEAYDAMYSVLIGQPLADYTIGGTAMELGSKLTTGPKAGTTVGDALSFGWGNTELLADGKTPAHKAMLEALARIELRLAGLAAPQIDATALAAALLANPAFAAALAGAAFDGAQRAERE